MRVRNAQDVEVLKKRINDELGVDLEKYHNEEVIENFTGLLVLPEYIVIWGIRPVLLAFLLYLLGFFFLDLFSVEYLIYGLLGFALFLTTGVLLGLFFLLRKMNSDLNGIVNYTLEIFKSALTDLGKTQGQITPKNKKYVLGMLFQGVIHVITIPILTKVFSDKIPLVGGFFAGLIRRILTYASDKLSFKDYHLNEELGRTDGSNVVADYSKTISYISKGLNTSLNIIFGVAKWPVLFGSLISLALLYLFLVLIN